MTTASGREYYIGLVHSEMAQADDDFTIGDHLDADYHLARAHVWATVAAAAPVDQPPRTPGLVFGEGRPAFTEPAPLYEPKGIHAPLRGETVGAECDFRWATTEVGDGQPPQCVHHGCFQPPGHTTAHQCRCGTLLTHQLGYDDQEPR